MRILYCNLKILSVSMVLANSALAPYEDLGNENDTFFYGIII